MGIKNINKSYSGEVFSHENNNNSYTNYHSNIFSGGGNHLNSLRSNKETFFGS